MTLRDWIDELCDLLDVEVELDEALILDFARDAAHNVEKVAAPLSTFLLGYAAGERGGNPQVVEELAGRATALAERFGAKADDLEDVEVEDIELDDPTLVDSE